MYYIAKGIIHDKLMALHERITNALTMRNIFARSHGASHAYGYFGDRFTVHFDDHRLPQPNWRRAKHLQGYSPNSKTAEGRAIAKEMKSPTYVMPHHWDAAYAMGCNPMKHTETTDHGIGFSTPGWGVYEWRNKRIVVIKSFPKFIPKDCQRISDLLYERIVAANQPKRKVTKRGKTSQKVRKGRKT